MVEVIFNGIFKKPLLDPENVIHKLNWKYIYELPDWEKLSDIVEDAVRNIADYAPHIKDKNFIAVAKLIHKIVAASYSANYDLHYNNMMARRTPYGVQLVITDPIANVGKQ